MTHRFCAPRADEISAVTWLAVPDLQQVRGTSRRPGFARIGRCALRRCSISGSVMRRAIVTRAASGLTFPNDVDLVAGSLQAPPNPTVYLPNWTRQWRPQIPVVARTSGGPGGDYRRGMLHSGSRGYAGRSGDCDAEPVRVAAGGRDDLPSTLRGFSGLRVRIWESEKSA